MFDIQKQQNRIIIENFKCSHCKVNELEIVFEKSKHDFTKKELDIANLSASIYES